MCPPTVVVRQGIARQRHHLWTQPLHNWKHCAPGLAATITTVICSSASSVLSPASCSKQI
uniref:Uncharacterized protein n=1 Tax=Arundo donax TaxID=35708 RepID=A0A0A8Z2T8_ARUDO